MKMNINNPNFLAKLQINKTLASKLIIKTENELEFGALRASGCI